MGVARFNSVAVKMTLIPCDSSSSPPSFPCPRHSDRSVVLSDHRVTAPKLISYPPYMHTSILVILFCRAHRVASRVIEHRRITYLPRCSIHNDHPPTNRTGSPTKRLQIYSSNTWNTWPKIPLTVLELMPFEHTTFPFRVNCFHTRPWCFSQAEVEIHETTEAGMNPNVWTALKAA